MGIIGDDTEPRIGGILLHYPSQSHLCGRGHGIGFVEDDELEGGNRGVVGGFRSGGEDLLCTCDCHKPWYAYGYLLGKVRRTCECLDLLAHNINASVIAGVELQNHLPHVFASIYSSRER